MLSEHQRTRVCWEDTQRRTDFATWTERYLGSGWMFFLPYLTAYFGWAVLRWPVNTSSTFPLSLRAVFVALHLFHGALVTIVLVRAARQGEINFRKAAAWACLATLLLIPGLYLEYPSDAWEHYRRIAEWDWIPEVQAHSTWTKFGYFLFASLRHPWPPAPAAAPGELGLASCLFSLLLSCHYHRLARRLGLGKTAAFVFVTVQALTFGNNAFGFYRYYGLSTTVLAQIAAVALTHSFADTLTRPGRMSGRDALLRTGAILALGSLAVASHPQAGGIALLGCLALGCWRLIGRGRATAVLLCVGIAAANAAAFFWLPRHATVEAIYRPTAWLNGWLGFNLLEWSSPAAQRAWVIIGIFGAANLVAGAWLLRRNHPSAWLTLVPPVALLLPAFSIPFASLLAQRGTSEVMAFHRMLFAIPSGLALVAAAEEALNRPVVRAWLAPLLAVVALALLVGVPGSFPGFNRFFHVIARFPADQAMAQHVAALDELAQFSTPSAYTVALPGAAYARGTLPGAETAWFRLVAYGYGPTPLDGMRFVSDRPPGLVALNRLPQFATPSSAMGFLSGHWSDRRTIPTAAAMQDTDDFAGWKMQRFGNMDFLSFQWVDTPATPAAPTRQ